MKRPFEIFDEMNQADEANKTANVAVCNFMVEAKTAKGGGHVIMGVPAEVITQLFTGERSVVLLVFDKKAYDRIDEQPKTTISVDIKELEKEIKPFDLSVSKPIGHGMLRDGRNYQVQVIITTDEGEFIDE